MKVIVNVNRISRIRVLKSSRNADTRKRLTSAASDVDLRAGDVKLRDAGWPGVMDRELLDAQETVAGRKAARNGHAIGLCKVTVQSVENPRLCIRWQALGCV